MFVNDPCGEVVYDQGFVCTDLRNKFLDDPTIDRLIKEAGGDLGREDTKTPAASVKRLAQKKKARGAIDRSFDTIFGRNYIL